MAWRSTRKPYPTRTRLCNQRRPLKARLRLGGTEHADRHRHHRVHAGGEADHEPTRESGERSKQGALGQSAGECVTGLWCSGGGRDTRHEQRQKHQGKRGSDSNGSAGSLHDVSTVCTWKTNRRFQTLADNLALRSATLAGAHCPQKSPSVRNFAGQRHFERDPPAGRALDEHAQILPRSRKITRLIGQLTEHELTVTLATRSFREPLSQSAQIRVSFACCASGQCSLGEVERLLGRAPTGSAHQRASRLAMVTHEVLNAAQRPKMESAPRGRTDAA